MTPEEIIERDFRIATADRVSQVAVHLDMDAEEIHVNYHGELFVCDCDSDDEFIFVPVNDNLHFTISFPISEDYLNCDLGQRR